MNYQNYQGAFRPAMPVNNESEINRQMPPKVQTPEIYIADNLFLNLGEDATFHMSFPDSKSERDRVFTGKIVEATRDHIMLHNESTGEWYLLPLLFLNYTVFRKEPKIPDIAKWHGN